MKLYFVTSNKGKIEEAKAILGFPIEIAELELDEIQSLDLEKIIIKKAEEAFKIIKKPLIVDDVAFHVKAWNGFPGAFIKYLREAGGNDLLLRMLQNEKNRSINLIAMVGFHDGKNIFTFRGEIPCIVSKVSRGTRGWGFDPVLIPENQKRTFAEMTDEEKNSASHRRLALEKLRKYLTENNYSFE